MFVHYVARYLDDIKRVLWVGGGDSMLLHEIIKYPSLELAVGLELDQQVTRSSFKHFGTQPHWDNDKVQWWYGDAAKSLLMLPREYFGSFDLVLVDLSETVMSMSVTEGLDIFGALSLLLKPEGIIVKNELYLEHFSDLFNYAAQVHFYDVPVICSQVLVLGSYKNDFLYQVPKERNMTDFLFLKPLNETKDRYDFWHGYRRNHTVPPKHCRQHGETDKVPIEQKTSPGILMILEVEDATGVLQPSEKVKDALVGVLEKEGLNVISTLMHTANDMGAVVLVILQEGYVVARPWPEHKYCAFDIHLWSRFDVQESVKRALIAVVGSSVGKSSSYRIVVGGIFGVKTWKADEKSRGPHGGTHLCDDPASSLRQVPPDRNAINTVLEEILSLIKESDSMMAVVCGQESEPCESVEVVGKNGKVSKVVALYACPGIKSSAGYATMMACEKDISNMLEKAVTEEKKLGGIIIDSSAPLGMGQILHRILKSTRNRKQMLSSDIMVVAVALDETRTWRHALLDRFRKDFVKYEPVFRAEVLFNSSDSSMELGIMSSGDDLFFDHLVNVTTSIEKVTGLVSDIQRIQGGLFKFRPDFDPQFSLPGDYDQSSPLEQWSSQQPLGLQTIFQLEVQWFEELVVGDRIWSIFDQAPFVPSNIFNGTVVAVNVDSTFDIHFDDGDEINGMERHLIHKLEPSQQKPDDKDLFLSAVQVKDALKHTLSLMTSENMTSAELHEFLGIADGCILVALWSGGSAIILWDGRMHVDINLFTYAESATIASEFAYHFKLQIPMIRTVLRDVQPRGYGRVVNFLKDIEPRRKPHWV
jgi:S-adenosylmethionine/arginine decarboxylase-like enzyme